MVSPVPPVPEDQMRMRLKPGRTVSPMAGTAISNGRPPFNITITGQDGDPLLIMREVNGRLTVEGDESKWDEAAKRFLYGMMQWSGQVGLHWKDEARKTAEGQ